MSPRQRDRSIHCQAQKGETKSGQSMARRAGSEWGEKQQNPRPQRLLQKALFIHPGALLSRGDGPAGWAQSLGPGTLRD